MERALFKALLLIAPDTTTCQSVLNAANGSIYQVLYSTPVIVPGY